MHSIKHWALLTRLSCRILVNLRYWQQCRLLLHDRLMFVYCPVLLFRHVALCFNVTKSCLLTLKLLLPMIVDCQVVTRYLCILINDSWLELFAFVANIVHRVLKLWGKQKEGSGDANPPAGFRGVCLLCFSEVEKCLRWATSQFSIILVAV